MTTDNGGPRPRTLLISCGALAREIVILVRENRWDNMRVQCLPAHLHNTPEKIPDLVRGLIQQARKNYDQVLVLYGDCGTGGKLDAVLDEERVERIYGTHCYEAYAGQHAYEALMRAEPGSFFLTDFLARHFERLIVRGMALDRFPKLRDVYFGNYKKVVYLAQTDDEALTEKAQAAAATLDLAFERRFTGLGDYERFLTARQNHAPD